METTTPAPQAAHKDVYALVTDRIIEELGKGTVPWRQPWPGAGIPRNFVSKRPYRGVNLLLLAGLGYEHNHFLTFKQAKDLQVRVKRGEAGYPVVFWKVDDAAKATDQASEAPNDSRRLILRYYHVFNVAQIEGIPESTFTALSREAREIPDCESVIANMPQRPEIRCKEQRAYYNPLQDFVNMPKQRTFESDESYYSTLFHELVHSTGHHSRLARKDLIEMSEFGSPSYSHEELVAEIGTCYLQSLAGITGRFEQSAAYIQNWLDVLKNDKRFIFSASSQAQKATDFILNVHPEAEDKEQVGE